MTSRAFTRPLDAADRAPTRVFARPLDAVDRLYTHADGTGWLVIAVKGVSAADPYMSGHFPGLTLYPAAFLLETVRQAVGQALRETWGEWLEVRSLRDFRLLLPMLAGDELIVSIRVAPDGGALRVRAGAARADGTPVAELDADLVAGGADAA